jgi:hypothetical protein
VHVRTLNNYSLDPAEMNNYSMVTMTCFLPFASALLPYQ